MTEYPVDTFQECGVCRVKHGSPTLCESCFHNRGVIAKVIRERDGLLAAMSTKESVKGSSQRSCDEAHDLANKDDLESRAREIAKALDRAFEEGREYERVTTQLKKLRRT
jgi:hypothetical protein